jgi:hypothetical protein
LLFIQANVLFLFGANARKQTCPRTRNENPRMMMSSTIFTKTWAMTGKLASADFISRSGVLDDAQVLAFRENLGKSRAHEIAAQPAVITIYKPSTSISTRAAAGTAVNVPSTIIKLPFPAYARSPIEKPARSYPNIDTTEAYSDADEAEDMASCHEPLSKKTKFDNMSTEPTGMVIDSPGSSAKNKKDSGFPSEEPLVVNNGGSIQESPTGQLDIEMDSENGQMSPARSSGANGTSTSSKALASPAHQSQLKERSESPSITASPSIGKRARSQKVRCFILIHIRK